MRKRNALEYHIFDCPDVGTLSVEITHAVNKGWQLVGGPFVHDGFVHQAMIREKTAEETALESGAVKKQNDGSLEFGVEGENA